MPKPEKPRFRVNVTFELEVDPEWYEDIDTPQQMAEIEQENLSVHPVAVAEWLSTLDYTVKVEVLGEGT
jgi:hypothetical protein